MPQRTPHPSFAIAVHGGAGTILKEKMTSEKERAYRDGIRDAIAAGYEMLDAGGSALDAVEAAVLVMEDSPLFNAGKGAVFTHEGHNEQDACIMDGATRDVGAVAGVRRIRNPILLARAVLDHSTHVLLGGEGAERFAEQHGIAFATPDYFYTEHRWNQLQAALERERSTGAASTRLDHSDADDNKDRVGTVGAVAVDRHGILAAATSTGGMTNKRFGRIGDTPIIGAGTYADNATCAVSATGVGEYIMRGVSSYDIAALMQYRNLSLLDAADEVIMRKLTDLGGDGGVVAIDRAGTIAMPFNSKGMYRGYRYPGEEPVIAIWEE
jgi:beta-aspartyl-peptidase (threonine type)